MKHNKFSILSKTLSTALIALLFSTSFLLTSCDDEDPAKENTPELITKATLIFTPDGDGDGLPTVRVTATDPDNIGVQPLEVDGPINLRAGVTYTLTFELINELADPTDEEYDITAEVTEEDEEHLFFFGWTNNVFSDPTGNGNIDNRADDVNYNDELDNNNLPTGLNTRWTTINTNGTGTFRVMLKHQPDLKSATSSSSTGETDLDLSFTINIQIPTTPAQ